MRGAGAWSGAMLRALVWGLPMKMYMLTELQSNR
jgi:hypothetical protein